MPKLEHLLSGGYSPNVEDRRGYEWGSSPGREALASGLGMYLGGSGVLAEMLGLRPQKAGVLENQLGLGDIPSVSFPVQAMGIVRGAGRDLYNYASGIDPTKSVLGEALMQHGRTRQAEMNMRENLGGKLWEEMTTQEKINWFESKGFTQGSAK